MPLLKKTILIFLGIICALVILETALRIGGAVQLDKQEKRNNIFIEKKDLVKVLCIGGSTTYWGGEYSYPRQLENILNKKINSISFQVINKGIPGINTGMVATSLTRQITENKPDIVIIMMGINDRFDDNMNHKYSNPLTRLKIYKLGSIILEHLSFIKAKTEIDRDKYGNDLMSDNYRKGVSLYYKGRYKDAIDYLKKEITGNTENYSAHEKLIDSYWILNKKDEIKVFYEKNLIKYPDSSVMNLSIGKYYLKKRNFIKAAKLSEKAISLDNTNADGYLNLFKCYSSLNKAKEAETILNIAINNNLEDSRLYLALGWFYLNRNKYAEAEKHFMASINRNPYDINSSIGLATLYQNRGEYKKSVKALKKAVRHNPHNEKLYSILGLFYKEQGKNREADSAFSKANKKRSLYLNPYTSANYIKVAKSVLIKGISLVCMQYPMRSIEPLQIMLKEIPGIVYIENLVNFKEAVNKNGYSEYFVDMFAGDFGHCTEKGNLLIAENAAKGIINKVIKNSKEK